MEATLEEGEDASAATKALQAQAEGLVEDHKRNMLTSIEELYQLSQVQSEVRGLENGIRSAQQKLAALREQNPRLLEVPAGA